MAVGGAIARLFVRLGIDKGEFNAGAASVRTETLGLKDSMAGATTGASLLDDTLKGLAAAGLAGVAVKAGQAAFSLAMLGAESMRAEDALNRVAAAGSQSGAAIAAAMAKAVAGTVDDEAMMAAATGAMVMGLKLTEQEWANLAAGAKYHARLIGEDTQTVFEGALNAIERGQPRMLATLKFPGAKDAINALAESFDSSASSMTEAQRQAALFELVMKTLNGEMDKYGAMAPDLIDSTDALAESWANLQETIGMKIAPPLNESVSGLNNLINLNFDPFIANVARSAAEGNVLDKALLGIIMTNSGLREALLGSGSAATETGDSFMILGWAINLVKAEMKTGTAAGDALAASMRALDKALYLKNIKTLAAQFDALHKGMKDSKADMDELRGAMYTGDLLSGAGDAAVQLAIYREEERKANEQLAQDTADANKQAAEDSAAAWQQSYDDAQRAAEDFRSMIQAALQPSAVTALDFDQTAAGTYADKWDENARRLNAIAEGGFEELKKHADWAAILKIPPEILAGSEAALKDWAARTSAAVTNLERPDLLNVDAAIAAIQEEINRKAAIELSLDIITKAAVEKGLVTGEDAKAQVAKALGLETALPVSLSISEENKKAFTDSLVGISVPVGLEAPAKAETEASMVTLIESLRVGFTEQTTAVSWAGIMIATMTGQIKDRQQDLKVLGGQVGAPIWDGLLDRLKGSGIVNHIIAEVLAALAEGVED